MKFTVLNSPNADVGVTHKFLHAPRLFVSTIRHTRRCGGVCGSHDLYTLQTHEIRIQFEGEKLPHYCH